MKMYIALLGLITLNWALKVNAISLTEPRESKLVFKKRESRLRRNRMPRTYPGHLRSSVNDGAILFRLDPVLINNMKQMEKTFLSYPSKTVYEPLKITGRRRRGTQKDDDIIIRLPPIEVSLVNNLEDNSESNSKEKRSSEPIVWEIDYPGSNKSKRCVAEGARDVRQTDESHSKEPAIFWNSLTESKAHRSQTTPDVLALPIPGGSPVILMLFPKMEEELKSNKPISDVVQEYLTNAITAINKQTRLKQK